MMHDGRKIVEGTPDEIRANELVHELYLGGRVTDDGIEAPHEHGDRQPAPAPAGRGPLLAVKDLNVHYGRAHVLQDVSFEMGHEPVVAHRAQRHGQDDAVQRDHADPSGARRAARSPSRAASSSGARPTRSRGAGHRLRAPGAAAVRVAHRRRAPADGRAAARRAPLDARRRLRAVPAAGRAPPNGGMQLSGGEQQMLAIGRALLGNPKLLIMDEPSEGLAPTIIETLIETFRGARRRGPGDPRGRAEPRHGHRDGRAPARDGRRRISAETTAAELVDDPELQRR